MRGAHVRWWNGASNAPDVKLKVSGNVLDWAGKTWAKEGNAMHIARSDDGRAAVLYHRGAITRMAAWRVFANGSPFTIEWTVPQSRLGGESWEDAARREGEKHLAYIQSFDSDMPAAYGKVIRRADCHLIVKVLDVTERQEGFGGSGYLLSMTDGSERLLRGPWHGGAPAGYVEVTAVDTSKSPDKWEARRAWHRRGGYAGLYITEDLFLRIMARHCAHVPIARVQRTYGTRLEPFRVEWGVPKSEIIELERGRAERKEPAGEFWRVHWDARECYCGTLRIPTFGFRPEVVDLPTAADYELAKRRPW
ncbi:hypothetical protein WT01_15830 [Burkholderia cepacia]|nr:hypothetical protein WT01_15830 [Burkholderia cepacia]